MKEIVIHDELKIDEAAKEFVKSMGNSSVFAFYGEMGAGKTTFIKAICRILKVKDNVSSPTFALVYEYYSELRGPVYHFDLYRIREIEELYDLGYEDYFYGGNLCFIEWPELGEDLLPVGTEKIRIVKNQDNTRSVFIDS